MQEIYNRSEELVTVIITCFNHGTYLNKAIESVLSQSYKNIQIIVVDDGSTDNTRLISEKYPVQYIYQANQGLSAARNVGIDNGSGLYFVFLDADDWLLPDAILKNHKYLQHNIKAAFVSGGHQKVYELEANTCNESIKVSENHYMHFLMGNYIGMHAAVMYRHWAFNDIKFDVSLQACEDYDLYLKISRIYPVIHHTNLIAAYRFHDTNMSGNKVKMLEFALLALRRQFKDLVNKKEKRCFNKGIKDWKKHYTKFIYAEMLQLYTQGKKPGKEKMSALLKYNRRFYLKFLLKTVLVGKNAKIFFPFLFR